MSDWIHGRHSVQEALRANRDIGKVFFAEGVQKSSVQDMIQTLQERRIPYQWVPRAKLDQLSESRNHQGVMAQVAAYPYASIDDLFKQAEKKEQSPFFLLLDGLEDPHNLGAILRTAEATGVHGIIIPKHRAVGLTSIVAKTSAGAIEYVPVAQATNLNRVADELKEHGIWLVGSDDNAKQEYTTVDYTIPVALVIGNEGTGVSQMMKKRCDFSVKLPMMGRVPSLNASVAAGVLMYEVLRKRRGV
jgi:23S rRNA (guanosine2251-2'-O)-methyltransferase